MVMTTLFLYIIGNIGVLRQIIDSLTITFIRLYSVRDLLKENRNQDKARKRKFEGKIIVITGASSGIGRQARS